MCGPYGTAHLSIPIAKSAIGICYRRLTSELRGRFPWNSEVGYWSFAMYCYRSSDSPIGGTIGVPIVWGSSHSTFLGHFFGRCIFSAMGSLTCKVYIWGESWMDVVWTCISLAFTAAVVSMCWGSNLVSSSLYFWVISLRCSSLARFSWILKNYMGNW